MRYDVIHLRCFNQLALVLALAAEWVPSQEDCTGLAPFVAVKLRAVSVGLWLFGRSLVPILYYHSVETNF